MSEDYIINGYQLNNGRKGSLSVSYLLEAGESQADIDAAVLTQCKAELRTAINAERANKIASATVEMDGVVYDANEAAKVNIGGAVTTFLALSGMGQGDDFSQDWIAVDDSTHALNGAKIVELGMMVGSSISEIMVTANLSKVALAAAESIEAAEAIVADYKAA